MGATYEIGKINCVSNFVLYNIIKILNIIFKMLFTHSKTIMSFIDALNELKFSDNI